MTTQTRAAESVQTPRDAREFAQEIARICFNDEIRAHVARELLTWTLTPEDGRTAAAREGALLALGTLTAAYDGQYKD